MASTHSFSFTYGRSVQSCAWILCAAVEGLFNHTAPAVLGPCWVPPWCDRMSWCPGAQDSVIQGCASLSLMSGKVAPLRELGHWSSVCCVSLPPSLDLFGTQSVLSGDMKLSMQKGTSQCETWATCRLGQFQVLCFSN